MEMRTKPSQYTTHPPTLLRDQGTNIQGRISAVPSPQPRGSKCTRDWHLLIGAKHANGVWMLADYSTFLTASQCQLWCVLICLPATITWHHCAHDQADGGGWTNRLVLKHARCLVDTILNLEGWYRSWFNKMIICMARYSAADKICMNCFVTTYKSRSDVHVINVSQTQ